MSLYRTENIHLLYKILLGSNPLIACILAIRGGGGNPINTSIELVDLFTIFYFPLLRERVRVRGLFVYTSGGIL